MRIYLSSLKGFVYSIQTFVLFILRFTFLEGWGNGGGENGSHDVTKEMCERDQGSER